MQSLGPHFRPAESESAFKQDLQVTGVHFMRCADFDGPSLVPKVQTYHSLSMTVTHTSPSSILGSASDWLCNHSLIAQVV